MPAKAKTLEKVAKKLGLLKSAVGYSRKILKN